MEMKIREIKTILTSPGRNYLIVKVTTENGITGYGDATLNGRELAVQSVIDNYLRDWLVGYNADRITDIWQMVFRGTYWRGGPVFMTALAGIDMALWDIKGKRAHMPLYSLIGGRCRDRAAVYYHAHGTKRDELIKRAKEMIKTGIKAIRYSFDIKDMHDQNVFYRQPHQDIKIKRIETDAIKNEGMWDSEVYIKNLLETTQELRNAVGTSMELIHDVHGRLTPIQAARLAKELEKYSLYFLEDPVDSNDKNGLQLVRNNSSTPIAIGELFNTIFDCEYILTNRLVDYIRVDISHFGGITPVLQISNFADVHSIKTAFHGPSDISPFAHAANIHIDLSIPNFGIQETFETDAVLEDVFDLPYCYKDGFITITDRPGLGVGFNEEAAQTYRYKKRYLPILRDDMGSVHNW